MGMEQTIETIKKRDSVRRLNNRPRNPLFSSTVSFTFWKYPQNERETYNSGWMKTKKDIYMFLYRIFHNWCSEWDKV